MTPEQLKASILQYAIQGKLVEQRPEEGTGEELYQQIQAEKQRLIKEGKIKKEKSLPEITDDEIPFDIPDSWKWVRWGDLSFSIQYGYNAPAKRTGRVKMVRISDIQNGKVIWETVPFCDINEAEIQTYLLATNDILFARTGGTVGKSYIVKEIPEDAIYAGYLIRTRYSDTLCPEYLYYFMQTQLYWTQLRNGTIATAQPNCNGQTLSKMILPLPPLAEQNRIVAKIEDLLPYVDRYAVAYEKLEQFNAKFPEDMKKSILQYAIQGKLVEQRPEEGTGEDLYHQIQTEKQRLIKEGKIKKEKPLAEIAEDEIPFDIPETWKWVRLSEIISVLGDGIHGTPVFDEMGEYYFVNGNNLTKGHIVFKADTKKVSFDEYEKHKKPLDENTILISINGTIGNYAFYAGEPIILGKSACYFSVLTGVDKEYVRHLINTKFFMDYAVKEATQTTIKNVSLKAMRMLPVPLPPLAEQKRIVARLEEILPLCERLK